MFYCSAINGRQAEEVLLAQNKFRTKFMRRRLALIKCSNFLVAMRLGDTPVPIPNTKVKT